MFHSKKSLYPVSLAALLLLGPAAAAKSILVEQHQSIQEALDNLAEVGDVITVQGVHRENVTIRMSGVTLKGAHSAVIDGQYRGPCVTVEADDVTVEDFELLNGDGGIAVSGDRVTIDRNEIESASGPAIRVSGSDATVSKNWAVGCSSGIEVEASHNQSVTTIDGNRVSLGNRYVGIYAHGGQLVVRRNHLLRINNPMVLYPSHPSAVSQISRNTIRLTSSEVIDQEDDEEDVFRGGEEEVFQFAALHVVQVGAGVLLEKNTVADVAWRGIFVEGDNVTLDGNRVRNAGQHGIALSESGNFLVTNNEISGAVENGLDLDNVEDGEVSRNEIKTSGRQGIDLYTSGGDIGFLDNDVRGNGRGGFFLYGNRLLIAGNTSEENLGDGIDLIGGINCDILDNRCRYNSHEGIDNTGMDSRIQRNFCFKNGGKIGPDIAGSGKDGRGTVTSDSGRNNFGIGGLSTRARLDFDTPAP